MAFNDNWDGVRRKPLMETLNPSDLDPKNPRMSANLAKEIDGIMRLLLPGEEMADVAWERLNKLKKLLERK